MVLLSIAWYTLQYDVVSDFVQFFEQYASKILTPRRMH